MIWFVTFAAVVLINLNYGLVIGISFALLTVIFRSQWPRSVLLGLVKNTSDFKGCRQYDVDQPEGFFIIRFDAPLFFANCELFLERIRE